MKVAQSCPTLLKGGNYLYFRANKLTSKEPPSLESKSGESEPRTLKLCLLTSHCSFSTYSIFVVVVDHAM